MKKTISICAAVALTALGASVQAQEITGRVISSTPVIQQVQVPRQICSEQPVAMQQPRSGAGAVIGAIAGGVLGNTIGHGMGRAAATAIGIAGGAAVGDRLEGGGVAGVQNMQHCTTQTSLENRTVGYNVTYEYGGRQHTVQMPYDPGQSIRLQVSPVGSAGPQEASPLVGGEIAVSSTVGIPVLPARVVYPAYAPSYPAYAPSYPAYAPSYYPGYYPAYYPPVGISLGWGFSSGWGGHRPHHHRGHWR